MARYSAVVLGGGLSGLGAAYSLASAGWKNIIVLERGSEPGGLAGSFEHDGRSYPLGYHHILPRDRTLLAFLKIVGASERIRWRRIRMLFETASGCVDLSSPAGFARFPLSPADKLRFARLMIRAYAKRSWLDWAGRSAAELVDSWASPAVRERLFEPLCQLKFELPCERVSAAWLGARLHFREGAAPLGYIPDANWTKVLCHGLAELLRNAGVETRVRTTVERLHTLGNHVVEVVCDGERFPADVVVSTLPTHTYLDLVPYEHTPQLASIRYTALISTICGAPRVPLPPFYWMNLSACRSTACAIFRLDALNPTLGSADEMCINFVTHLAGPHRPLFRVQEGELVSRYLDDFGTVFGRRLEPRWVHTSRVAAYSPIFERGFQNPPVRSGTWKNVYFAGNYRTFPSVASTGTALESGLEAAAAILRDRLHQIGHLSQHASSAPAA